VKAHAAAEQLSAYLDAELADDQRTAVEAHLRECADCARHLEELLAVDATARAVAVDAPAGYFESFPGRLRARLEDRRSRRVPAWALAAAAGLALAVITPLTLQRRDSPAATQSLPKPEAPLRGAASTPATVATGQRDGSTAQETVKSEPAIAPLRRQRAEAPLPEAPGADAPEAEEKKTADAVAGSRADEAATSKRTVLPMPSPLGSAVPREERQAAVLAVDSEFSEAPPASNAAPAAATPPPAATGEPGPALQKERPAAAKAAGPSRLSADRTAAVDKAGEEAFAALSRRGSRTAEEARDLRDDWRAFVSAHPRHPLTDEARVRALEWGALAWRLGKDETDRSDVEGEAAAYLARDDARQRDRVRVLLETLAR
jgi:hypothetical protein